MVTIHYYYTYEKGHQLVKYPVFEVPKTYDLTTIDYLTDQYWPVGPVLDSPKSNHFCGLDASQPWCF